MPLHLNIHVVLSVPTNTKAALKSKIVAEFTVSHLYLCSNGLLDLCVRFVFDSHNVFSFTLSPQPASIPPRAVIEIQASSCRRGAAGEAAGSGEGGCVQHRGSKEVERSDITDYIFALESIYNGLRVQLLASVLSHLALICVCACISSDH